MTTPTAPTTPASPPTPQPAAKPAPKPTVAAATKAKPKVKRSIPWSKISLIIWGLLWLSWTIWQAKVSSDLIRIPDNVTPEVTLPTVDEKALDEIRSRDSSGLITPSQNNAPRANPFE